MTVELREITPDNRPAVEALRVAPGQEQFVDGVKESLDEAAVKPSAKPWFRAVYADGEPVGFVMLQDGVPEDSKYRSPYSPYYLWRFLIDERHQRRGYGTAALGLVVEYLRTRPGAETLLTSVVVGPGSPRNFYLRYGFTSTGKVIEGEEALTLPLA